MAFFSGAILSSVVISLAISVALTVAQMLLFPRQQPQRPQQQQPNLSPPPNGTVNERQAVPPLRAICGRVRTGGDYATLEEKGGMAYHVLVHAAHRIEGYVQHWLHDELVTLDENGRVTAPAHFGAEVVRIRTRRGVPAETEWYELAAALPGIWTSEHRGDGLSQVRMTCAPVDAQSFAKIYPQGMPLHTCLVDGARIYDPRDDDQDPDDPSTWVFSRNLALIRLHHLTHPAGGRQTLADMYLPDWQVAADVADELVINRDGAEEPRYWGGVTWKYKGDGQDAVTIGTKIDVAGEMVIYSRGDGRIGVHAGRMEVPSIRLDARHITSISYDANQSQASTVLAARGRFTDPRNAWTLSDAAIYGDPYSGDESTQRTATVENDVVQSHNHIQRLQKLKFIRANAPRVAIKIAYDEDVADVLGARFVRVHYPSRGLDEAVIEIVEGAKLSLAPDDFSISFQGIVVPADLYAFNAATEEGIPGGIVGPIEATGVPVPTGFAIEMKSESLASGATASYVLAHWTHFEDTFTHELQYQVSDGSRPPRSVASNPDEDEVRTPSLEAGVTYRLRLRAWSAGAPSAWTDYLVTGAGGDTGGSGDPTPPAAPTGFSAEAATPFGIDATWTNPASANLDNVVLYIAPSSDFATAAVEYTDRSGASATPTHHATWPISGTYYLWVRAFNASGTGSDLVGPESVSL
ncbi:hypothetical protein [Reyranella sp.]|uniref:hypothetical protein n=1 Tax=Reyranella sp. TaxID=1929291 RepID=UPI003D0C31C1